MGAAAVTRGWHAPAGARLAVGLGQVGQLVSHGVAEALASGDRVVFAPGSAVDDPQATSSAPSSSAQNAPATALEYRDAVTGSSLYTGNARSLQYTRPSMAECDREWLSLSTMR